MISKYISYLSYSYWVKISLPALLLILVLFFQGSIKSGVTDRMHKKTEKITAELTAGIGKENEKFAKALGKISKVADVELANYSQYKNREFINKQNNDIKVVIKVEESRAVRNTDPVWSGDEAPDFIVTSIFIGKTKKFAIVNDKVVRVGDELSSGESVKAIKDGKVLISGRWGNRWLYVTY